MKKEYAALIAALIIIAFLFGYMAVTIFPADDPTNNLLVFTEPSAENETTGYQTETTVEIMDSELHPTVTETDAEETVASMPQNNMETSPSVFYEDVTETAYVLTGVNVRSGPGTDFSVLGISPYGSSITRTGIGSNGWSRVLYNGETAFILSEYLSTVPPDQFGGTGSQITEEMDHPNFFEDVSETVYAITDVNVRVGPGLDYAIRGIYPQGSSISRTGISGNGWSRVIYHGETAYMASEYLSENPEDVLVKAPDKEPDDQYDMDDSVARVLELVNDYRSQRGLAPLELSSELCDAADIRAQEITQVFDHTRPDGSDCFSVSPLAYGENIAMGTGMDADLAMNGWMNSQGHRENILNDSFVTIGIGYCYVGRNGYWVQLFGY